MGRSPKYVRAQRKVEQGEAKGGVGRVRCRGWQGRERWGRAGRGRRGGERGGGPACVKGNKWRGGGCRRRRNSEVGVVKIFSGKGLFFNNWPAGGSFSSGYDLIKTIFICLSISYDIIKYVQCVW